MGRFNGFACLVLLLDMIFLGKAIAAAARSEASDPYPPNTRTISINESVHGGPTGEVKPPISSKASAAEGDQDSGVPEGAAAPEIRRLGKHHSSSDKSVAGAGLIIGGLLTVAFAAVYSYIRVTRKKGWIASSSASDH